MSSPVVAAGRFYSAERLLSSIPLAIVAGLLLAWLGIYLLAIGLGALTSNGEPIAWVEVPVGLFVIVTAMTAGAMTVSRKTEVFYFGVLFGAMFLVIPVATLTGGLFLVWSARGSVLEWSVGATVTLGMVTLELIGAYKLLGGW